jgi:hypothetical protein
LAKIIANSNSICGDIVIQARQENLPMSDQFWLTNAQLKRIEPFFRGHAATLQPRAAHPTA